ncbi:unnamed protein product [Arctogadus glacialis]
MDRLEERMCNTHHRLLKLFCKTEQECVCQSCTETDHKFHAVVPLKEAYDVKTAQLGKMEAEVQQMILSRIRMLQGIKDTVEFSKKDADREIANGVQVFTALKRHIGKCQVLNDNPAVRLPLRAELQKVGVFVDYDEGLVFFYDVEARVHIYSATGCTFN